MKGKVTEPARKRGQSKTIFQRSFWRILTLLTVALWPNGSRAEDKPVAPISQYNLEAGKLALQGYDPVAYQSVGKALKGSFEIEAQHEGVTYRFATESFREIFKKNPSRYAPAYGGWCATAMVRGEKVEIDPKNFKVTNDRLFLFFKAFYADARKEWVKDEPGNIVKADAHWKELLSQP